MRLGCLLPGRRLPADERALREGYERLEQMGEKSFLSTAAGYLG